MNGTQHLVLLLLIAWQLMACVPAQQPLPAPSPATGAESTEMAQAQTGLPAATVTPTPAPVTPQPLPPLTITLDAPFSLKLNQQGILEATGFTLEFAQIVEDSRCPRQVDCVWSGQARLIINVWLAGQEPAAFELNTLPSSNQNLISYEGYQIQLLNLDPYPETPEQPIAPEEYQATFVVSEE